MPVADGLRQLLSSENRFWPNDDELRKKIRTAPFYQYGRPQQRRLVLQRIEESYEHPEPVDFAAAQFDHRVREASVARERVDADAG
ncbi:hypothetical protein ABZV61_32905 [Streptomyces sp900116325]|uniref:Uncharacterized protein n=1 Tax=Streptomyces sp. 900116325 TaxID=3154295 RepID=A0ABV2UHZ1_9ACTN